MKLIAKLLSSLLSALPGSPFRAMIVAIDDSAILSTLNWLIPFGAAVSMLELWAVSMAAYYGYRAVKGVVTKIIGKFFS